MSGANSLMEITEEIKKAFVTLCYSWGGDTPAEAVWAANEFMQIFMETKEIVLLDESTENYEEFINQIKQKDL